MQNHHHQFKRVCKFCVTNNKFWFATLQDAKSSSSTLQNVEGPSFLSNELRYIKWHCYPASPFPDGFQPMKLVALKLYDSLQKQLWRDDKHLPLLKVLELCKMVNLLSTPNFDGLPCLQKLTLEYCDELQEIHSSLGKHTSLQYVKVSSCGKLKLFPTIVHMRYLKSLRITNFHKRLEFPVIQSNMKSLIELYLSNMGINALLQSVGDQCPNLISLALVKCSYSKNKEVKFYGLNNLEEFKLRQPNDLKMPRHICISWLIRKVASERDRYRSQIFNFRLWLVYPQLRHSLQRLDLSLCGLKDGEITSDIGELSNLQELDLSWNYFTRLDFSLSQLTRLKLLNLSRCKSLVELPKLPSGLVVLRAVGCDSLTNLGYLYTDCKWLFKVSLVGGGVITDGSRLLQSMIEGNALQNLSMVLAVKGLEITKEFRPRLVRKRGRSRLELPENWSTEFSGFLMCSVGGFWSV